MTEEEVKSEIHTEAVLRAFERATLSKLPQVVKDRYDAENLLYSEVSLHTAERVAEGEEKGRAEGRAEGEAKGRAEALSEIALTLKKTLNLPDDQIAKILSSTHPGLPA